MGADCRGACARRRDSLILAVLPDKVNQKIGLRKRALIVAVGDWTVKETLRLGGVLGLLVELECAGVQELPLAESTLKWKFALVRLQVIVHGILVLLCHATVLADEEIVRILDVFKDHCNLCTYA